MPHGWHKHIDTGGINIKATNDISFYFRKKKYRVCKVLFNIRDSHSFRFLDQFSSSLYLDVFGAKPPRSHACFGGGHFDVNSAGSWFWFIYSKDWKTDFSGSQ